MKSMAVCVRAAWFSDAASRSCSASVRALHMHACVHGGHVVHVRLCVGRGGEGSIRGGWMHMAMTSFIWGTPFVGGSV